MGARTGLESRAMLNADGKLPVVTDPVEPGSGCDRRTVLGGLAVGALVAGCRIDDPGAADDAPADGPAPDGVAGTGFELCGANICVDLTHPANNGLNTVGMTRIITQGTTKILIVRVSDNAFNTTSSICTHSGCTVRYSAAATQLQCPCHGSKYELNGTVIVGAVANQRDLPSFTNDFSMADNLLTIML